MTIHYEKDDKGIVVLSMDMENHSQNVINDSFLDAFKRVTQKLFSEDSLAGDFPRPTGSEFRTEHEAF